MAIVNKYNIEDNFSIKLTRAADKPVHGAPITNEEAAAIHQKQENQDGMAAARAKQHLADELFQKSIKPWLFCPANGCIERVAQGHKCCTHNLCPPPMPAGHK
jgi:hypothetical protein